MTDKTRLHHERSPRVTWKWKYQRRQLLRERGDDRSDR